MSRKGSERNALTDEANKPGTAGEENEMKWLLPDDEISPPIPITAGDHAEAWYTVVIGGAMTLRIHRPRGWMTPTNEPRQAWLVEGVALGGYVGLSRGTDGWHIGTPADVPSPALVALATGRGWRVL